MSNYYERRSEQQEVDTDAAKDYITKYKHIMKSDFKKNYTLCHSFYSYILFCLKYRCDLKYEYKKISKFLIFRHFIFPLPLLCFILLLPIELIFIYLANFSGYGVLQLISVIFSIATPLLLILFIINCSYVEDF